MERMLVLFHKPEDASEFDRHYREIHVPLARKLPGLQRYTAGRAPHGLGADSPYHLVVELDFADRDALRAAFRSEQGKAVSADTAAIGVSATVVTYEVEDVQ